MKRRVTIRAVRRWLLPGVCLGTVLLPGSRSAWAVKQDNVPDWVLAATQQTLPKYPAETKAVVLLDETTCTVGGDGHAVEHHRRVVKILRQEGRDDALVVVPFDKDTKLMSLHVWSIGPDGHQYAVKDNEIVEYGDPGEGGILYQDERYKVARAPGRDPGGVVAFEYEQRLPGYMSEDDWVFQQDIPSVSRAFTLELPTGYTYGAVWAHAKPVQAIDMEHQRWRWEVKDVQGIDLNSVPMHPSELALAGRMTVHFAGPGVATPVGGTWQSIGEWYTQLSKDRMAASPEIASKASELTAGKTDFADKTEAIAEFVQKQIRYFVIERGIGGLQPHAADEIFRNRYGDCKDKATLLSAMLSTVGVHSTIVLVDSRRGLVDPDAPSLMGNHAIAAIEIPAGYNSARLRSVVTTKSGKRYLIFDPTWEKTAFGQLESNLQGGYGLLAEGSESQVIQFPVLSPELNRIHRTASFELAADGSLKGTVMDKRFGDLSENRRDLFSKGTTKEQQDYLDHVLQQDFTSFSMSDLKVENVDAFNKDLTTSFSLAADRFGMKMGSLLMVRPRVLGQEGLNPDTEARKVPIDLEETMQEQDDYTIKLPAGYAVDEMPDPVKVDLGFAAYESSTQLVGDTLHYKRTYTVREVTLPPEKYGDVQKLARVIGADEQSRAVLKKQ